MLTKKTLIGVVLALFLVVLILYRFGFFNRTKLTPNDESKNGNNQECVRAGCSGELCVKAELADQIATTCEYKAEYACYQKATCALQSDGSCGFNQTEELLECLKTANSSKQLQIN